MKIPSNNQWNQTNQGDILGVLNTTQNCSLEVPGKIKLSRKPFALLTSNDDANLAHILGIVYYNNSYIVMTSDGLFTFDLSAGAVAQIASSPNTTLSSDIQVVYDRAYVTINNNLSYWNGSSWTNSIESLTSGVPHPMTVFDSLPTYKLAVGNSYQVKLIDSSGNASGTVLSLPQQYQITTLKYRNGYLYIGTKHLNGGEAKVFIWDGATANANYEVPTGASWVFSMTEYQNSVAFITDDGALSYVSGNSKALLGALPVYYDKTAVWQDGSTGLTLNGRVMHRGMVTVGEDIYINLNGDLDSGYVPNMKSGVWVFSPQKGLTHKTGYSLDRYVQDTTFTVSNSIITTSATHNLKDGDAVQFTGVSGLSGVKTNQIYYVSVQSTTTIKLALSRKALKNSNFVTITGSVSGDELVYVPNTDYYGGYGGVQGAITLNAKGSSNLDMWASPVIWGGACDDFDGSVVYAVQTFTDSYNVGSFSTQKIYANNLKQTWQKVTGFVKGILSSSEVAILKYKKEDAAGYPTRVFQGVWGQTNQIHSISSTYDEDEWSDIEIKDEVCIVDGAGRGYTAHVTAKESSSSTYVITLDDSIGTAAKSVYFYVDNYRKVKSLNSTRETTELLQWGFPAVKSPSISFKVETRGFEPEIAALDVENQKDK